MNRTDPRSRLESVGVAEGTVLVTGATGTVGRYVVPRLTDHGVPVRRAVRDVIGAPDEQTAVLISPTPASGHLPTEVSTASS